MTSHPAGCAPLLTCAPAAAAVGIVAGTAVGTADKIATVVDSFAVYLQNGEVHWYLCDWTDASSFCPPAGLSYVDERIPIVVAVVSEDDV